MAWHELFDAFHRRIRQDQPSAAVLREKRDIILRKVALASGGRFEPFNQGSYAMATGLVPYRGKELDIDLGLIFPVDVDRVDSAVPKRLVHTALLGHTKNVEWRRHCVTVFYAKSARGPAFHVDLAVYARDRDGDLHLAVGRQSSREHNRGWVRSDPKALVNLVKAHLQGDAQAQFRRTVRYLKRWRDHQWGPEGRGSPPGIALTVLALKHFEHIPGEDRLALLVVVERILGSREWGGRVCADLPVDPENDTLEGLTDAQMERFLSKLDALRATLEDVGQRPRGLTIWQLRKQFGDEFGA